MNPLRRPIEVVLAALVLLMTSPITLVSAALIYLNDRGPVIHRRRVMGIGGEEFDAFKLRTMRVDADQLLMRHPELSRPHEDQHKLRDDPRVTPVGRPLRRLSIDELPQLLNVLRGEMSLVGPRIFHPSELSFYGADAAEIISVAPGMTGLWQVSGRQTLNRSRRVELDLTYVRERSLRLDALILLRTIAAVLRGRGAY